MTVTDQTRVGRRHEQSIPESKLSSLRSWQKHGTSAWVPHYHSEDPESKLEKFGVERMFHSQGSSTMTAGEKKETVREEITKADIRKVEWIFWALTWLRGKFYNWSCAICQSEHRFMDTTMETYRQPCEQGTWETERNFMFRFNSSSRLVFIQIFQIYFEIRFPWKVFQVKNLWLAWLLLRLTVTMVVRLSSWFNDWTGFLGFWINQVCD